ncbi:hypothetical protein ACDT10_24570 [Mycobacterium intracellulare]|uniref:Uncharacterized protein n=1 Tax=Mycobacterium intracellulare subsp. chimaera TaxID=222805 RepID=A0ABT7P9B9_MYCIT|nr:MULTISPECIES: hypothetical protein [Mycobacterium]ETZ27691.1 hypothetical protein L842_4587 [Mycobacterium intracellulare MIN_052511_1280]MDA3663360.1 hypothetical protein [Mycobacterium xenopi]MDM3909167.1 hypothetical protein [Mycobacterium intracellulare subsp. chimaera]MDM3929881.1 hypothetical protein [Mycobacterium intracellulare subsp. chimaera]MEE3751059.1 hypothetical protein [Mycobacterium intracellulare]
MSTPRNGRFAAEAKYLPHYNDIQQITGTPSSPPLRPLWQCRS